MKEIVYRVNEGVGLPPIPAEIRAGIAETALHHLDGVLDFQIDNEEHVELLAQMVALGGNLQDEIWREKVSGKLTSYLTRDSSRMSRNMYISLAYHLRDYLSPETAASVLHQEEFHFTDTDINKTRLLALFDSFPDNIEQLRRVIAGYFLTKPFSGGEWPKNLTHWTNALWVLARNSQSEEDLLAYEEMLTKGLTRRIYRASNHGLQYYRVALQALSQLDTAVAYGVAQRHIEKVVSNQGWRCDDSEILGEEYNAQKYKELLSPSIEFLADLLINANLPPDSPEWQVLEKYGGQYPEKMFGWQRWRFRLPVDIYDGLQRNLFSLAEPERLKWALSRFAWGNPTTEDKDLVSSASRYTTHDSLRTHCQQVLDPNYQALAPLQTATALSTRPRNDLQQQMHAWVGGAPTSLRKMGVALVAKLCQSTHYHRLEKPMENWLHSAYLEERLMATAILLRLNPGLILAELSSDRANVELKAAIVECLSETH